MKRAKSQGFPYQPRRVKGSETRVELSAMADMSCAASDRKSNESLILRLTTYARKQGLF